MHTGFIYTLLFPAVALSLSKKPSIFRNIRMEAMDTFLVVDMGSSSIRCSAYSCADNVAIESSRVQFKQCLLDDTGSTDGNFISNLVNDAVDECLARLRSEFSPVTVKALAFASFAMSLVGCDQDFVPLSPVYTYASRLERDALNDIDPSQVSKHFTRTGTILRHPRYSPHIVSHGYTSQYH